MSRTSIISIAMMLVATLLRAQTPLERMNSIKQSGDYYWEEYVDADVSTANNGAIDRLKTLIFMEHSESMSTADTVNLNRISPYVQTINMTRSTRQRIFAYVKKTDVESLLGGTAPVQRESQPPSLPGELRQGILSKADIRKVINYLEESKAAGRIESYGSLKDDAQDAWLVIFNKESLKPLCILSPLDTDGKRVNLQTGASEALRSYRDRNCLAVWFKPGRLQIAD